MKILIVVNYRPSGGLTEAVRELAESLRKESFIVDIASTYGTIKGRIKNIFNIIRITRHYDFIIASGCADYGFLPILIGVIAGRLYKKNILVDFHEGYPLPFMNKFGKAIKLFLGNIPVTVASEYLLNVLKRYEFNVVLIPHQFHYENFPKREKAFSWNKKFIWVGIFQFMYDPETALKACELVLNERNDAEFHFFGKGPLLERMKNKYAHPNIKFRGFVPRDGLLKEYQYFSTLINTSFGDNFPLKLIEASFNELLVLSAKCGGPATIYNDEECLFFEKEDYKTLSKLILDILNNPHPYDLFRINMHKKVRGFTWNRVKDRWLALILPKKYE